MAFIRPYRESDAAAIDHICRATLPPALSAKPETVRLAPYLWARQYTYLTPQHCFVLEDPTASPTHPSAPVNNVVGYVIGTPSIASFIESYPSYVSSVLSPDVERPAPGPPLDWELPGGGGVDPARLAQIAYDGEELLRNGGREGMCEAFPATLHIDILEGWRNGGWGGRLVERFVGSLPEGTGVHISAAGTNTRAVPFYERCGFRMLEGGEAMGSIWMGRPGAA
ncbi:uncharacterized protein DNG_10190 [Cephalotrichum gorgonifer]|uniref:N-acetyltransferase domain-containing protein n=1 Tax=Cephalotrichum gorgonifer TaxID=2041049 RepID=A0AAE8N764_9PEZI|nr:uncharacterized protein DNG_10190 [Cephalotrichum gorgonifer]